MKPTTTRERVLLMIAPAVTVIAVYAWLLFPKQELQQAEQALEAARQAEPSLTEFKAREYRLSQLEEQLSRAREELAVWEQRRREVLGRRGSGSSAQLAAVQDLTSLFVSRGLHLVDEGPLDGESNMRLPGPLSRAEEAIRGSSAEVPRTLWRLRFHGPYPDVLAVVSHLAETGHQAIPVQLVMEEAKAETAWRTWTLVIWI